MHILLINDNPVVSRLMALCVQNEDILLEEVKNIDNTNRDTYDIVFVDEASYRKTIQHLKHKLRIEKSILFTNNDVKISDFDMQIKKPFLPSEIKEIFKQIKEKNTSQSNTRILDSNEVEKIKDLLNMDENEVSDLSLSETEYEERKIKVIKEQLISEGLEIIEEDKILDNLENAKKKKENNKIIKEQIIKKALYKAFNALKKKEQKKFLKGKKVAIRLQLKDKK